MKRLAFDCSSYLKTGMLVGTDTKDGLVVEWEGKKVTVPSAEYGYENVMNMMVKAINDTGVQPCDCLLVMEGLHSKSKRLLIDSTYKSGRDKRPPEFNDEFNRLKSYLETVWKGLGAIVIQQDYCEADDVFSWLAQETEDDLVIASRDADLGVLNGVNAYGAQIRTYNDGVFDIVKLNGEPFVHPPKYITLYKALVGDATEAPGVKGFGAKSFQKLAEQYGYDGLDELMGLLEAGKLDPLHGLAEETGHKLVKLMVADEANAVKSWKLVKLYPQWVNTMRQPIQIRPGKIIEAPADADKRLLDWYGQNVLITTENYADAMAFFKDEAAKSPDLPFDIETSTPQESDDWIAAIPKAGDMVDQLGSVLTGFSFTFGPNRQYTYYVCVDHADTDNIKMSEARKMIEVAIDSGKSIIIQNNFFELTVLAMAQDEDGSQWVDHWKNRGARGFLPNVLDTKMEASYVDENISLGLKFRSKHHLGYEQQTFEATTTKVGPTASLPLGGKLRDTWDEEAEGGSVEMQKRQYKMRELTGAEVFGYGADDTICTAALHNYFKLVMQLEHTWKVYLDVEIDASYQHAKNFIDGIPFSLEKMRELETHDTATYDKAWAVVRAYLMEKGWEGTVPPTYGADITAAQIKQAYAIVQGCSDDEEDEVELQPSVEDEEESPAYHAEPKQEEPKDAFISSKVRTPSKLVALARELGHETFAGMLEQCLAGEHEKFTAWVREHFTGEPLFKVSNKQLCKLLYEVMKLPIRVRNKPTAKMREAGKEGNPKGDALAIEYALRDATPEQKAVLESMKLMQMVRTRRSLYYSKFPHFLHWKTGLLHPTHNQCATNTRRPTDAKPNKNQLPKHAKITGQAARFRETFVPHKPNAVAVSMDFSAQELRVIADYSKDPNMVACYVGDNKRDMHSFIAAGIVQKRYPDKRHWTYDVFMSHLKNPDSEHHTFCKEMRALGKKVGFTTEYGAMAPKLAMTMLVTEAEAQSFIDAKEQAFAGAAKWKLAVIEEAKQTGFVKTKLGAKRHLAAFFTGDDHWLRSKAERQSVNFKIQSSCAEMTKLAEGRMWQRGLFYKYDAVCYGAIYDEVVASVSLEHLQAFLEEMHACMVVQYADMEVPVLSEISFGPNFHEQIECGAAPDAKAIQQGLKELVKMQPSYAKMLELA